MLKLNPHELMHLLLAVGVLLNGISIIVLAIAIIGLKS
jgi:hypothetical protein